MIFNLALNLFTELGHQFMMLRIEFWLPLLLELLFFSVNRILIMIMHACVCNIKEQAGFYITIFCCIICLWCNGQSL